MSTAPLPKVEIEPYHPLDAALSEGDHHSDNLPFDREVAESNARIQCANPLRTARSRLWGAKRGEIVSRIEGFTVQRSDDLNLLSLVQVVLTASGSGVPLTTCVVLKILGNHFSRERITTAVGKNAVGQRFLADLVIADVVMEVILRHRRRVRLILRSPLLVGFYRCKFGIDATRIQGNEMPCLISQIAIRLRRSRYPAVRAEGGVLKTAAAAPPRSRDFTFYHAIVLEWCRTTRSRSGARRSVSLLQAAGMATATISGWAMVEVVLLGPAQKAGLTAGDKGQDGWEDEEAAGGTPWGPARTGPARPCRP